MKKKTTPKPTKQTQEEPVLLWVFLVTAPQEPRALPASLALGVIPATAKGQSRAGSAAALPPRARVQGLQEGG